jgi:predicted metal-dependent enzyme (double-stranded beta helix superfamily)
MEAPWKRPLSFWPGREQQEETMFDIDELIEQCQQAIRETDPRLAVHDVLERAVSRPDDVAAALPATSAEIQPLYVADDLTVLKVVWAPGMQIWPHNHLMWADIALYGGQEDNSFFRRTPGGIEAAGGRQLCTSDVAALGPETIHAVANPRRTFTGAIHVYGGDITSRPGRSEWDLDTLDEMPYDFERAKQIFAEANAG